MVNIFLQLAFSEQFFLSSIQVTCEKKFVKAKILS